MSEVPDNDEIQRRIQEALDSLSTTPSQQVDGVYRKVAKLLPDVINELDDTDFIRISVGDMRRAIIEIREKAMMAGYEIGFKDRQKKSKL